MEIVTMDFETAKLVTTDFPAETEYRRYLPVEIEPGKFAIGIFTAQLGLIDYIRLEVD